MRAADDEELLEYYQRELSYLRKASVDFARRYPKVASRLELAPDECRDPHVERMLEGFAFLTSRLQHRLDAEFPEISGSLLGIIHPQYLSPIPSLGIAHFEPDPEQGQLSVGHLIAKGTQLQTETGDGHACRFRTAYPVTLWPVVVEEAALDSPDRFDFLAAAANVARVLRLRLRSLQAPFEELCIDRLRFYLHGERRVANALYEMLLANVLRVGILPAGRDEPFFVGADAIRAVGFAPDEEVIPYPSHLHPGYRLLQEYFLFPEKFLFFDLERLGLNASGEVCDILILLDRLAAERLTVDASNFQLGCTPMVNLFQRSSEPIRLDHRQSEYRLLADGRRERTTEVHSIRKVTVSSDAADDSRVVEPYFSYTHTQQSADQQAYWVARRSGTGRRDLPGSDVHLRFVDLDFNIAKPPDETLFAHVLCTNRDLAEHLPNDARLEIEETGPIRRISCLSRPTEQVQPPLRGATLWRLISHLSLNYLSLSEGGASLKALREILRLTSFANSVTTNQQILGIRELSSRRVLGHLHTEFGGDFCRGNEITLLLDEAQFVGASPFLFASVLNHFFANYASVNSFTQLIIKSKQREGVWKRWPPMAGERVVL